MIQVSIFMKSGNVHHGTFKSFEAEINGGKITAMRWECLSESSFYVDPREIEMISMSKIEEKAGD